MSRPALSLRARLLWSVGLATLVVWSIAVLVSYQGARHEAIELLDGQLAQSARLLLSQIQHEWPDPGEEAEQHHEDAHSSDNDESDMEEWASFQAGSPAHDYEQPLEFRIWALSGRHQGQLLLRSPHAPDMDLHERMGYAFIQHEGQEWRSLTLRDEAGRFQVQVTQPTGQRTQAALEVAQRVSVPIILALPLLLLGLYLAVGRGLNPLERLARDVSLRDPHALSPLPVAGMPKETLPLINALNALLARLEQALDNERRFTADAAHELRTPLAALKVQAQVAQLAQDSATRDHALAQVRHGVERAIRLVEQLLRLARLDPIAQLTAPPTLDLHALIPAALNGLQAEAKARGVNLELQIPEGMQVRGDADLLGLALRNILENALRHGPSTGTVALGASQDGGGLRLWVRDNGPGVAESELARLTQRFYRGQDVTSEGSGLGLAIVQRIAQLHGGQLELANLPQGGFQASLHLPG